MEILKHARGPNDGEIVPFGPEPAGFKDEINHRTWKAGYTDRDGQRMVRLSGGRYRSISHKYRENYERIFRHG